MRTRLKYWQDKLKMTEHSVRFRYRAHVSAWRAWQREVKQLEKARAKIEAYLAKSK